MKKAFSLLELIIVLVLISILASFFITKYTNLFESSAKATIKADIALINSAISKANSKKILLNEEKINFLDNALTNQKGIELFTNILQKGLLSSDDDKKELGKWIKISSNEYKAYFTKNVFIEFKFEDNKFLCQSSLEVCLEFE